MNPLSTRERINRTRRWASFLAVPGFVLFAVSGSLAEAHPAFIPFVFVGFAMFGGSIASIMFTGRCVRCRRLLGRMFSQAGGTPWSLAADLRFCPYCGASIDEGDGNIQT